MITEKSIENNLNCFTEISLSDPVIHHKTAKCNVTLHKINGESANFPLLISYPKVLNTNHQPLLRLAFCMPLLNYGLFTKIFRLSFPLTLSDYTLLTTLNTIFCRDIYVNKILRRRTNYILPDFIPNINAISATDAEPDTIIQPTTIELDIELLREINNKKCGILSSGGKESLLTYGILKEIGAEAYPLYINESGGHWRTALPAYHYHEKNELHTHRVWTNVDRFYNFMLDNLRIIRKDHRSVRADTYPIRLCIFPFYVFTLLPIFIDNQIGNLLIGSEFDDIRSPPRYQGIPHYYGVYDQHQDYDQLMNAWYANRVPGLKQWSALRTISGLIVERILVNRYPELAQYQRSCHSCHFEHNQIVPCGSCSKCQGVLLFLLANNIDPKIMQFKSLNISQFLDEKIPKVLRLDEDEKNHAFYLIKENTSFASSEKIEHVEKIHLHKTIIDIEYIPEQFRKKILTVLESFTTGYCKLHGTNWISIKKSENSY